MAPNPIDHDPSQRKNQTSAEPMNTPSPLMPQGSLHQPHSSGKSTVRIAVFTIVAVHAVFFTGLLMQGCKRDTSQVENKPVEPTNALSEFGQLTNSYYSSVDELPFSSLTNAAPPLPVETVQETSAPPATLPLPSFNSIAQPAVQTPAPTLGNSAGTASGLATNEPEPAVKEYTVMRGDALYNIARAHGVSLAALKHANPNIDPAKIHPGQKILIPASDKAVSGTGAAAKPAEAVTGGETHVVRPGENLTRIAKRYSTTVKALREANDLTGDRLSVGQRLKLPASASLTATNPATKNAAVR